MAKKRMFSNQIVDSDAFLDMPSSSQNLYFHLVMRADDEGFIGNHKRVMRAVGASEDDFKILVAKRFILTFESGVVVIKHWLIHNAIRMDRFNPTSYQDEKKLLITKENKAYTEINRNGNQLATTGSPKLSKVKLSKVKLSKSSIVIKDDTPFSLKEEIQKLNDSSRRDLNIIGLFFEERNPDIKTREQYMVALKRHLKAASQLKPFSDNQILKAVEYAKKEYKDIWTIETLIKICTK